jgi:hypothetical protein
MFRSIWTIVKTWSLCRILNMFCVWCLQLGCASCGSCDFYDYDYYYLKVYNYKVKKFKIQDTCYVKCTIYCARYHR